MASKVKTVDLEGTSGAYYAPATITNSGDIIHTAGQAGVSRHGCLPSDYESQIHLALLNIQRILVAAKVSVTDILKLNLYIVNYDPAQRKHAPIIQRFLGSHRPAITLVPVSQLAVPGWLFEIDATVARKAQPLRQITNSLSAIPKVDVVVMGAGLAGLTAASHIIKAGYSCVVLEARNRVGGRTWSHKASTGTGILDMGAAWINDTNQSRMAQLAREFNAEFIEQNTEGDIIAQHTDKSLVAVPYGEIPSHSEEMKAHLAHIRDTVEADCQALNMQSTKDPKSAELDSMTFLAYVQRLGANETAVHTATIWTRAMLGQDPGEISALFFLRYCRAGGGLMQMRSDRKGGGQHLRIRQGTQMFALNLANTLPAGTVRLNSPVAAVTQLGPQSILVSTGASGGESTVVHARKVVSAIPHPVLRTVDFSPPLPPAKQLLIDAYRYGYYQKVLAVFKTPFWTTSSSAGGGGGGGGAACGLAQSFVGPAAVFRDTSSPQDDKHVLTCFVGGRVGLQWSQLPSTEQRTEAIVRQIADVFADGLVSAVRDQLVEVVGLAWSEERWNGYGCPSPALGPGVLSAVDGKTLEASVGDVHFAGTETSRVWTGYMEGAVRSGDREAERILKDFRGVVAKI